MKFSLSTLSLLLTSTLLADPQIEVYFSPKGGCTEAVVDALTKAKSNVLVQAYSFTSPAIAKTLTEAHGRGVKVEVVLEIGQGPVPFRGSPTGKSAGRGLLPNGLKTVRSRW